MVKRCIKCSKPLIVNGIHLGIPFGHWRSFTTPGEWSSMLVCSGCYDMITANSPESSKVCLS